jgi:flavin reductase (DIM6/NTAB) family NADH-FMN oxidoreductase RutF
MNDMHYYAPEDGHRLAHDPFKAIVAPRPIGWISTRALNGGFNLAPYSFSNAICDHPPIVMFSSAGWKDSVTNAQATGEFAWNLATRRLAEAMNASSAAVAPEVDEFALSGLTPAPSVKIKAPRVAESPASLECKVVEIVELRDIEGKPADHWVVMGQVVGVHIDKAYLRDGLFDTGAAGAILRAGYLADYAAINSDSMFKMRRPNQIRR